MAPYHTQLWDIHLRTARHAPTARRAVWLRPPGELLELLERPSHLSHVRESEDVVVRDTSGDSISCNYIRAQQGKCCARDLKGLSSTRSVVDGCRGEAALRLSTSLGLHHVSIIHTSNSCNHIHIHHSTRIRGDLKGYPLRGAPWTGYTGEAVLHFSTLP